MGEPLTVPEWDPQPEQFGHQWLLKRKSIGGATESTYVLTKTDVGKRISMRVSGVLAAYQHVEVLSLVRPSFHRSFRSQVLSVLPNIGPASIASLSARLPSPGGAQSTPKSVGFHE